MVADPAAVGMDPAALAEIERLFHAQVTEERLHPGAALAVYRRGRLVLDLTAGWADAQRGVPVRPDTLFQLRSAGKPLASVAVLQQPESVARMLTPEVDGEWDRTLGGPVRRGLGFEISGVYEPTARETGATSTARTFYHTGIGTMLCWGDIDLELGMAFMTNGFRPGRRELRTDANGGTIVAVAADDTGLRCNRAISDAVRGACTASSATS